MFIVPTFNGHFSFTDKLLSSASSEEQICLIFSSDDERNDFKSKFNHQNYKSLIYAAPDYPAINKKLYALDVLSDQYDYIAAIDDESIFIKHTSPILETIWNANPLVANPSILGREIMEQHLKLLGIDNYPIDTNLYWWFNQIPVYKSDNIKDFLNWLKCHNYSTDSMNQFNCVYKGFDYIFYGIYLIMEHGYIPRIIQKEALHGLIESNINDHELLSQVNWSVQAIVPSTHILFHQDRL